MRALIQKVKEASVTIKGETISKINNGLLVFLGIEDADGKEDIEWLTYKITGLRIFNDEKGVMNLSVRDVDGELLVVSQFTLMAQTKKGNRPSYIKASKREVSEPMYNLFCKELEIRAQRNVERGIFGADMQINLINDGPVTIWIDTKNKE